MAHEKFPVEVLTPEGKVFDEAVEMVSTRTVVGSIGVLAHHEPLLAMLDPTELRLYRSESDVARYVPFASFESWAGVKVDAPRWTRFAAGLARRSEAAGEELRTDIAERLLRATALDSGALDGLLAANPELTAAVLSSAFGHDEAMADVKESLRLVAECNYRALVLARDAARDGRAVDEQLIAVLHDVI